MHAVACAPTHPIINKQINKQIIAYVNKVKRTRIAITVVLLLVVSILCSELILSQLDLPSRVPPAGQ